MHRRNKTYTHQTDIWTTVTEVKGKRGKIIHVIIFQYIYISDDFVILKTNFTLSTHISFHILQFYNLHIERMLTNSKNFAMFQKHLFIFLNTLQVVCCDAYIQHNVHKIHFRQLHP